MECSGCLLVEAGIRINSSITQGQCLKAYPTLPDLEQEDILLAKGNRFRINSIQQRK